MILFEVSEEEQEVDEGDGVEEDAVGDEGEVAGVDVVDRVDEDFVAAEESGSFNCCCGCSCFVVGTLFSISCRIISKGKCCLELHRSLH